MMLKKDGTVWARGLNGEGEFANDSTANSFIPVQVVRPAKAARLVAQPQRWQALNDGTAIYCPRATDRLNASANRQAKKRGPAVLSELKFAMIVAARLSVAVFKILGYTLIYTAQAIWFCAQGRSDKIGDAMGSLSRGAVDAFSDIFKT